MLNRFLTDDLLRVPHCLMLLLGAFMVSKGIYTGFNVPLGQFDQPMGMDFYCFWSAGRLALDGHIHDIFNPKAFAAFQQNYLGAPDNFYIPWFYPPLLLLYISCVFALMPYKIAFLVYLLVSVGSYYFLARRFFPATKPLYIIAFPAFWFNLFSGQNGLLTAVILVGGLLSIARQPGIAGCILALLSFKPQFCLALPIFLIIERRSQTIVAGIGTLGLLVALSTGLWGTAVWQHFADGLSGAQHYNQMTDIIRFEMQAHLYGTLRAIGVNHVPALSLNYAFAAVAGCAAIRIWLQPFDAQVKYAVVILMTLLLPPHLLYYDFVATGAVIVWLWPQENLRPALIILWFAPVMWPVLGKFGIPQLPLAASMLLYQISRTVPKAANRAV
jgi:alpha-1,2-mannosyltransferase